MTETARRRASFNTLTVSQVRLLTKDSVEVTFEVPEHLGHARYAHTELTLEKIQALIEN